jgi:iron only hydrogenase large subunit-like protein
MDYLQPIYTESTQCQDCYKCLRRCDVKAIQILDGHARVMDSQCVYCGKCVKNCPAQAKKVRTDLERVKLLISGGERVIVSLAPSFVSEFAGTRPQVLAAGLKRLGFYGVSETSIGAEEVSANIAGYLKTAGPGIHISSACPSVVELVKKYYPNFAHCVTPVYSPALTHAKMLKKIYGEDTKIVFVGPCIAKKIEADRYPELLSAALSFRELHEWFARDRVNLDGNLCGSASLENDGFIPERAKQGRLYPVDGGMIEGIKAGCGVTESGFMTFSGIGNIRAALSEFEELKLTRPLFLELLACEGGCVNGPLVSREGGTVSKRLEIISELDAAEYTQREPELDIYCQWQTEPVVQSSFSREEIFNALEKVGKYSPADELNCGGCGYETCRQFAQALLEGKAEPQMCLGYMRKLANKKVDALIRTMPGGVVMVDDNMKVIECNKRFAQLLGRDVLDIFLSRPGMAGADIAKLLPAPELFRNVLESGSETAEKDIKFNNSILHLSVFTIEPHRLVGGFLQDITAPAMHKEQIVNRAREVIAKNLQTVQQIAYLLGENAADSEVILNSIVNTFTAQPLEKPDAKD